ncbi:MAG: 7-cyano-7-deazaguanine synthase [Desulfovibrionaceae bacterium]
MHDDLNRKLDQARALIQENDSAVVLFSGGADSSLAAILAAEVLGEKAAAVTFDTEFVSARALDMARHHARAAGLEHRMVPLKVLDDERIQANGRDRCYLCKKRMLYSVPDPVVMDGTTADDDPDRPGMAALFERGGLCVLRSAGLTKEDIRQALRELEHPAAEAPPDSCLATRIEPGSAITPERLRVVESLEDLLGDMGRRNFRARILPDGVRVETASGLASDQKTRLLRLAGELGLENMTFRAGR